MIIEFEQQDACVGMGLLGPIGICVWKAQPTAQAVQQSAKLLDHAVDKYAQIMVLTVVVENCPFPEAAERKGLTEMLHKHQGKVHAFAQVIEGTGVTLTLTRSLISAMAVASRQTVKVFSHASAATTWLGDRARELDSKAPIAADAIAQAVERLRAP